MSKKISKQQENAKPATRTDRKLPGLVVRTEVKAGASSYGMS